MDNLKNIPQCKFRLPWWLRLVIAAIVLIIIIGSLFYLLPKKESELQVENNQTEDIYWEFTNEIYDKIQENFWEIINDEQLTNLYELAAEKATEQEQDLAPKNKAGLKRMFDNITAGMDDNQKKDFSAQVTAIVLANLEPFGRSGLYSEEQKQDLLNVVANVDPDVNLYQSLGVPQNASPLQVQQSYGQKTQELNQIISDEQKTQEEKQEAQKQLAMTNRAYQTLGKEEEREVYDQSGVESTVESKILTPNIFYLQMDKLSPTSFEEFQQEANAVDDKGPELNTLILDLRGNVGGAIDLMQWFLGPFIGFNQYAYEFYQQGEYEPFKTQVGWLPSLVRYKKVVVLIDERAQSSAEIMAASLKKYNVGVLVGVPTKGWGTVESIFPIDNQIDDQKIYSIFLAHHLTLREDQLPIEGHGVDPHININDNDWPQQLLAYFSDQSLVNQVKRLINTK